MKKYIYFTLLIFLFSISFIQDKANAAPKLEVNAEVGIGGKIKRYAPVPLKITITNNGTDFSGDFVIDVHESYDVGAGLVYPLTIAEGETKTIHVTLNALEEAYNSMGTQQKIFHFYEGGIEKGKSIDYKGTSTLRPFFHELDHIYLFTLTENSDRLSNLYQLTEDASSGVEIFHLKDIKDYELPTDSNGFQLVDILVVDEVSLTDLSQEQQQALFHWVQLGGTLLVGASDQISVSMGVFQSHLPLTLLQERITVSANNLSKITNNGKFDQNIEVQKATKNKESKILLQDGNTILAASKKIGSGQIIQTTFSLGDQPLAGMAGYGKLLSQILDMPNFTSSNYYNSDFYHYLPDDVQRINEIFPSFEVTTHWLMIVIIIYILLVGPILYVVLKRLDKREHAWWIIPVMAISLSVIMFLFGAKDRIMNAQIQQASYLKVNEDKSLDGYYINSLLTNKKGDYKFTTDEYTTITTLNRDTDMFEGINKLHDQFYITKHANGSTLTLRDLNYWSVQSMIGKTTVQHAGNLDINITLKNNNIEGTIKNNFPFKLKDVAIWSGYKEMVIGDIEPNETLKVSETVQSTTLLSPNYMYGSGELPKKKGEILKYRLESLKYGLVTLVQNDNLPVVIGWTDEPLVGTKMEGNSKIEATNYIVQTFKPNIQLSGDIIVGNDVLTSYVESLGNSYFAYRTEEIQNKWELEKGEYEYFVYVPEEITKNVKAWNELSLKNSNKNLIDIQIWNSKKLKYEDLSEQNMKITSNISEYIYEGEIKFKFKYVGENYSVIRMPEVELKGVAK